MGVCAQDCLLGEGSVKDQICKWRELRFQFRLRALYKGGPETEEASRPVEKRGGSPSLDGPAETRQDPGVPASPDHMLPSGEHGASVWGGWAGALGGDASLPGSSGPGVALGETTSCCSAGCHDAFPHLLVLTWAPLAPLARVLTDHALCLSRWSGGTSLAPSCRARAATWTL